MSTHERCAWPGCGSEQVAIVLVGLPLCDHHWEKWCQIEDTEEEQRYLNEWRAELEKEDDDG